MSHVSPSYMYYPVIIARSLLTAVSKRHGGDCTCIIHYRNVPYLIYALQRFLLLTCHIRNYTRGFFYQSGVRLHPTPPASQAHSV
jgi:hypothetical protein